MVFMGYVWSGVFPIRQKLNLSCCSLKAKQILLTLHNMNTTTLDVVLKTF